MTKNLGVIRLTIDGRWTISEFSSMLDTLKRSYLKLNTFNSISKEFDKRLISYIKDGQNRQYFHFLENSYPRAIMVSRPDPAYFEPLINAARDETSDLYIHSIEIHSPGYIELLGYWPVLVILANFINLWRQENTKRQKIESEERIEKDRNDANVKIAIAQRIENLTREEAGELMERFIDHTANDSIEQLKTIALDLRINSIEALSNELNDSEERPGKSLNQ